MSKPNSIAIALEISKRRKKMAKGGKVDESAKSEQRPMPEEKDKDASMVMRNEERSSMPPKPRIQPIKHPKMVPSTGFSSRLRDQEDDLEASAKPQKHQGMSEDKGPDEEEIMASHFAEGGEVPDPKKDDKGDCTPRADAGWGAVICRAEGGMIDEDADDQDMISTIMAKRRKMAEGGAVDLDENAEEQPNAFYDRNEAILKENYDSDMDDASQPMDSNEHGDKLSDEDAHDMISAIRRRMKSRMK